MCVLFEGLFHVLNHRCIGQLYTIGRLLNGILGVVGKRLLHFQYRVIKQYNNSLYHEMIYTSKQQSVQYYHTALTRD